MRRSALALLALPLAATACGGGRSSASATAATKEDPAAAVRNAARKTAAAGSEHLELLARVVSGGQTIELRGGGDFDTKARLGSLHATLATGGVNGAIDEVSHGTTIFVKSDLLTAMLPAGKAWIKLDLAKLARARGFDLPSLLGQDPSQAFKQLQSLRGVTQTGTAQIGGVATTRYHATIDVSKLPSATKTSSGAYDVWIGADGYVHRVRAVISNAGTKATVTTDFSGYGDKVSVDVPPATEVFDGSGTAIPGLGG
jgi:hypothetical protein